MKGKEIHNRAATVLKRKLLKIANTNLTDQLLMDGARERESSQNTKYNPTLKY